MDVGTAPPRIIAAWGVAFVCALGAYGIASLSSNAASQSLRRHDALAARQTDSLELLHALTQLETAHWALQLQGDAAAMDRLNALPPRIQGMLVTLARQTENPQRKAVAQGLMLRLDLYERQVRECFPGWEQGGCHGLSQRMHVMVRDAGILSVSALQQRQLAAGHALAKAHEAKSIFFGGMIAACLLALALRVVGLWLLVHCPAFIHEILRVASWRVCTSGRGGLPTSKKRPGSVLTVTRQAEPRV